MSPITVSKNSLSQINSRATQAGKRMIVQRKLSIHIPACVCVCVCVCLWAHVYIFAFWSGMYVLCDVYVSVCCHVHNTFICDDLFIKYMYVYVYVCYMYMFGTCMCMYVYVYVYVYVYAYVFAYACVYTGMRTWIHVYVHEFVYYGCIRVQSILVNDDWSFKWGSRNGESKLSLTW